MDPSEIVVDPIQDLQAARRSPLPFHTYIQRPESNPYLVSYLVI